jgi:hypothetical protein
LIVSVNIGFVSAIVELQNHEEYKIPKTSLQTLRIRNWNTLVHLIYMCTNTVFSAAFCAVPGLTTPISCPATTTRQVSVSQGPSSGMYVAARKLLHCWHTDHTIRTKLFTHAQTIYFYAQSLILSVWSVCQQCNSLFATAYTPDDGPCQTETCRVVVDEGHEIGVVKPGTARKAALRTYKKLSRNGPWRAMGLWDVEAPTFSR